MLCNCNEEDFDLTLQIQEYAPLAGLLYYKIGGQARYLLTAGSKEDVQQALDFVRKNDIQRLIVVGLGANLLFPDGLFDGAVLRVAQPEKPDIREISRGVSEPNEELVESFAGQTLDDVIQYAFTRDLIGLEWAGGLPGTVGAGVRGNVGAFGGELKDRLHSAKLVENAPGYRAFWLNNAELLFSYRGSIVKAAKNLVVTNAIFRLRRASAEELEKARSTYLGNIDYRNRSHPMEFPTCGSVFKNIDRGEYVERMLAVWPDARKEVEGRWHGKFSMGFAIGRLGLAGFRIGNAEISRKHNNFIVNLGDARFTDVTGLIDKVQGEFERLFGFRPEPEVEIISP